MEDCLVAFGSNLGESRQCLVDATQLLRGEDAVESLVCGEPVDTEPVGGPEGQAAFLNASIRFLTSLSAPDLFERLCMIEKALGRERRQRWGERKIDLDLLLYGTRVISDEDLIVPHPRMSFRRFVLQPARQIAAEMVHPLSGLTIKQLIAHLDNVKNRIVYICREANKDQLVVQTLKKKCSRLEWGFDEVFDIRSYDRAVNEAKLIVFSEDIEPELYELAVRFKGPTLNLRESVRFDSVIQEIEAAVTAMSSL